MRAGKALLAIAALALQGCEPLTGSDCPDIVPIDLSGIWTGVVSDAIPMRLDLRQARALPEPEEYVRFSGTASITIPGPVEASDTVRGWTRGIPGCDDENRIRDQSVRVSAGMTVRPADHLELDLYFELSGSVESGEIVGRLQYTGPTAIVFDAEGHVVGFELDRFTDSSFTLTRSPSEIVASLPHHVVR